MVIVYPFSSYVFPPILLIKPEFSSVDNMMDTLRDRVVVTKAKKTVQPEVDDRFHSRVFREVLC